MSVKVENFLCVCVCFYVLNTVRFSLCYFFFSIFYSLSPLPHTEIVIATEKSMVSKTKKNTTVCGRCFFSTGRATEDDILEPINTTLVLQFVARHACHGRLGYLPNDPAQSAIQDGLRLKQYIAHKQDDKPYRN